jgi:phosphoribosylformylglycinamidine synthase subunit PurS
VKVAVTVSLKEGVLDPQGKAVEQALHNLGFANVADVRVGKVISFNVDAPDAASAQTQAADMSRKLLANTVIERFDVQVHS